MKINHSMLNVGLSHNSILLITPYIHEFSSKDNLGRFGVRAISWSMQQNSNSNARIAKTTTKKSMQQVCIDFRTYNELKLYSNHKLSCQKGLAFISYDSKFHSFSFYIQTFYIHKAAIIWFPLILKSIQFFPINKLIIGNNITYRHEKLVSFFQVNRSPKKLNHQDIQEQSFRILSTYNPK